MDCALSRPGESTPSCVGSVDEQGNPDMRSFEPDWSALDSVVQAFADHGIILHVIPGEAVPVHGMWVPALGGYALADDPLDDPDPACDMDFIANTARTQQVQAALCNCLGFGSKNSALVLGRAT